MICFVEINTPICKKQLQYCDADYLLQHKIGSQQQEKREIKYPAGHLSQDVAIEPNYWWNDLNFKWEFYNLSVLKQ